MLNNLTIKNIKSFKEEANLKIAPLTLIYGPNSTGKSTLWKFLLTLNRSLTRGSGRNFINFSRTWDFANTRTISFDPNEESTFAFKFSTLNYGQKKVEDKNTGLEFKFTFTNSTVDPNFTNELDLIGDVEKKIKEKDAYSSDDKNQLLKDILKIKKATEKLKNIHKEKDVVEDKGIYLNDLQIIKDNKVFIKFKVYKIKNPLLTMMERSRVGGGRMMVSKKNVNYNERRHEEEIQNILKTFFKDKFKQQIGYEASKDMWNEEMDGPYKGQMRRYDFLGPDGPFNLEIRSKDYQKINYLFLPIEISEDILLWKEHFNFLQYLKELIKKNPTNKNKEEKKMYESYFEESFREDIQYHMAVTNIDVAKQIPEYQNTLDRIVAVMMATSIEEFSKLMAEEFRHIILKSSSFIPSQRLYGSRVYFEIFDGLVTKFVDAYVEKDAIDKDAEIFFKSYSDFNKYSLDDQLRYLFDFEKKELRNFKENHASNMYRNSPMFSQRYMVSLLENDEHKKGLIDLFRKVELPFDIKTQDDEKGNTVVSFTNKNIFGSQTNIPIEQSGNALQSIMTVFNDITRSEEETIIIEEPENKVHPKIQGNLIEIIAENVNENLNKVIIETHSEHFILRIQKLIREKKLTPDLVAINYVYLDENGNGSKIDHMKLDNNGKFISKWRHGFFNERLKEI